MDNQQRPQHPQRNTIQVLLIVAIMLLGVFLGFRLGKVSNHRAIGASGTNKLDAILNYASRNYVDSISVDDLVEKAIPEVLRHLDPHSVYIPASEMQGTNEELQGNFGGIGITFNMPDDTVVVMSVISGGPSQRVGVESGDRLLKINDSLIAGVKFPQDSVMKRLRGEVGTNVKVEMLRPSIGKSITFTIKRDVIPIKSVDVAYMLNSSTGYIKMSRFARTTHEEFVKAVKQLHKEGMTKLVLDLRDNSGGFLNQAFEITNEFLPKDELVVYTEGLHRKRENFFSNGRGLCLDDELVVLINENSASASEILAGAIQDNDRGTIVGRRSYGKGLVQEQIPFRDGSGFRLTIARYYTPTGRSIQKPYSSDLDEYFMDKYRRYQHRELEVADSVRQNDSLRFTTPKGKVVYGGGGITPDVFVPIDTIDTHNAFLTNVLAKNLLYRFTFSFTDKHRKQLSSIDNIAGIEAFFAAKPSLTADFIAYAAANGVRPVGDEWTTSKSLIERLLKAFIARNTQLDSQGYYYYIAPDDSALQRALQVLNNGAVTKNMQPRIRLKRSMEQRTC